MSLQAQIQAGFGRLVQAVNALNTLLRARDWTYYVIQGAAPTLVGTATAPVAGKVWAHTSGGVVRYRLVPSPYTRSQDAFYSTYANGVCSGLLCTRG